MIRVRNVSDAVVEFIEATEEQRDNLVMEIRCRMEKIRGVNNSIATTSSDTTTL